MRCCRPVTVAALWLAVAAHASAQEGLADSILALSGGRQVKVVWTRNTDRAGGNVFGGASTFKLMGYDTDTDACVEILGTLDDYSRPTLTSDGSRVVYTDRVENKIYAVSWNGSGRQLLRSGSGRRDAGDTWYDPATNKEWVYFEEGDNAGDYLLNGRILRLNLDDPGEVELVWDQTLATHGFIAVSGDGLWIAASLPWPDSGAILPDPDNPGSGQLINPATGHYGNGCWPTVTPDDRHIVGVFNQDGDGGMGMHRAWKLWDTPTSEMRMLDLHQVPGNSGWEICHPRMSKHPRFLTVTGPYDQGAMGDNNILAGGPQIEVFLGKVDAAFAEVTDWVQITDDGLADIYPHAWVAPEAPPPVRVDSFTASPTVILETGMATLQWETHNATAVSISPMVGEVEAAGSVAVSPSTTTTFTLSASGSGGPVTRSVTVAVVTMSLPLAVNCGDGTPAAASWQEEDPFRTGGAAHDLDGAVDLDGVPAAAPAAVYQTSVRGDHQYVFPVADGVYTVRLHFCVDATTPSTAMDVLVEGARVLDGLDVEAAAGGANRALVHEHVVAVEDGDGLRLQIEGSDGGEALLSGLEVVAGGELDTAPPQVTILTPAAGETLSGIVALHGVATDDVAVALVEVVVDDASWQEAEGTASWSYQLYGSLLEDGLHSIRVRALDPAGNSGSAEVTIFTHNAPQVTLLSPLGGERWAAGSQQRVRWSADNLDDVDIRFSLDGGDSWEVLASSLSSRDPGWGDLAWELPPASTDQAMVMICGYFDSQVRDTSALFTIAAASSGAPAEVPRDRVLVSAGCSCAGAGHEPPAPHLLLVVLLLARLRLVAARRRRSG